MKHTEFMILGDHPVLRRPDKYMPTKTEAEIYAKELRLIGYENVEISQIKNSGGK